jgi:hypothetical protein
MPCLVYSPSIHVCVCVYVCTGVHLESCIQVAGIVCLSLDVIVQVSVRCKRDSKAEISLIFQRTFAVPLRTELPLVGIQ